MVQRKKICLIHTSSPGEATALFPPLGVMQLSSYLGSEGHLVKILDREGLLLKSNSSLDRVDKITSTYINYIKPDYIGISALTPFISDAYHVAKLLKEKVGDIPIILGGPHATALGGDILNISPHIDIVVIGEGEETLKEIVGGMPLESIAGIAFKKDYMILLTPERSPIKELGTLPYPDWDGIDMKLYTRPSSSLIKGLYTKATTAITSRGCHSRCAHCAIGGAFKYKLNFFPVEYMIDQLENLLRMFNIKAVTFLDDQFTTDKARVYKICEQLIESGLSKVISWSAKISQDSIDKDLLSKMKEAGCIQTEIGFDSNSQRILDIINRGTTIAQNEDAVKLCKSKGIKIAADFMTNFPGETEEDMRETISFARRHNFIHINFKKMLPLPGTIFWHKLEGGTEDETGHNSLFEPDRNFTDIDDERFRWLFEGSKAWMERTNIINDMKGYLTFRGNDILSNKYKHNLKKFLSAWIAQRKYKIKYQFCKSKMI